MKQAATRDSHSERILRVLIYIQEHLDDALPLTDLARVAHYSPHHFHRVFRGMVGESVAAHTRRLRLERAALRLKSTDRPVTRIAFEAGYDSHEAFTRAFRAMFAQSPSAFRKANSTLALPDAANGVHFSADRRVTTFHPIVLGQPMKQVRIEQRTPIHVAFMRHQGPYKDSHKTWMQLMQWAGTRGLIGPDTVMLGRSYDDPEVTPPERLRYDACLQVDADVQPEGDVGVQIIAGGEYAVINHLGPYERLGDTYAWLLGQWLPASGHEARSSLPTFEIYHNDPQSTTPDQLSTDIYLPLQPRP